MPFYSDGKPPPDDGRSRYDIRQEVAKIEAKLLMMSLARIVITKADERFLSSVGMRWDE